MTSTHLAQQNNWTPGTRLRGTCKSMNVTDVIEIVSVGEVVMAKWLERDGRKHPEPMPSPWNLTCRDWEEIKP